MTVDVTIKSAKDKEARAVFAKHFRTQRRIENFFIPKIQHVIAEQFQDFIKAIYSHGFHYAKTHIVSIVKVEPVIKVIKELYHKSAVIQANIVLTYLKRPAKRKSFDFKRATLPPVPNASFSLSLNDLAPLIDQYFEIHLLNESALPITATTRRMIIRYLVSQVDGGKPLDQAIADFTSLAIDQAPRREPKSLKRARGIATTETTRALSFGGLIGAYMSEVDVDKVWVTCDDEKVRGEPNYKAPYPHVDLDLSVSGLFDAFYNGEMIKFPGDPDASIANTANCRCAMYFREKFHPDEIGDRSLDSFLNDFDADKYINDRLNGSV